MKTFEFFFEGVVLLTWLIVLLIHSLSLFFVNDYSASNNSIITFILLGLFQTQFMIKSEIQKLKDEL
jgi:hypothetical protein